MPYMIQPNRRSFMQTAAAAGLLAFAAPAKANAQEKDKARWIFMSDTHIPEDVSNEYRGFKPYENLKQIVPALLEADAEGVVIDGDLARLEGFAGDYANFKQLLQPVLDQTPVCMTLGNHDNRSNFQQAFGSHPGEPQSVAGKHVLSVDAGTARLLALDSLLYVNQVAGLLGKAQRGWLQDYLALADDKPILIFFHHTVAGGDGDLLDFDRAYEILKPHKQVKALVYGHSHVYSFEQRDGIHFINLPAVGYNFSDEDPVGWVEAELTATGASFKLHAFAGNTENDGQVTNVEWRR